MAAESWRRIDGVARKRKQRWINHNGVARRIKERWANIGGVVRCIWRELEVKLVDGTYRPNIAAFGTAIFSLQPDGTIFHTFGAGSGPSQSVWLTPQEGMNDYQVFAKIVSRVGAGDFPGTFNNWISLGSVERAWIANRPSNAGPGTDTIVFDLSIRRASDQVVLTTARITLISQG